MIIAALCALQTLSPNLDLGQPVAEHSYYLQIEKKGSDGTPDLKAVSNHWSKVTDRYFVHVDTRTMTRDAEGKIHLPIFDLKVKSDPIPYKQVGRAPAGLGEFRYVIAPTGSATTELSCSAIDVSQGSNVLQYVVQSTIEETEVRLVNNKPIKRTQSHVVYGIRSEGVGANEDYDPVADRRFSIGLTNKTGSSD